tara:strand:- start:495040 stop:495633 length:594 start_codon:yes stop_codon:yes gene_type:complete
MSRPRSILEKDAIERALILFWDKGYNRTSIADLGEAIGVGPSSIYNAFGSKQELFEKAMAQYMGTHADFVGQLFAKSGGMSTTHFVGELLSKLVKLYTDKTTPPGCAMMQAGGSGAASDSQACAVTLKMKTSLESSLYEFFKAKTANCEELSAPPKILAKFIVGTIRGLSQLACDGSSRKELLAVADHAATSCSQSD